MLPENASAGFLPFYRHLPYAELSRRLQSKMSLRVSNDQTTMFLAGVQEKMGVQFVPKSRRLLERVGRSLSTHILKPDTRQPRYQPSAINEYACMKLARALKLLVPDVCLLLVPEAAYVVQRYDRVDAAGNIVVLHQFDGCQLLGHGSGWKYQRQGGLVSICRLVEALRNLPVLGADLMQMQHWVMFNYLIGNAGAHCKNLSVLVEDKGYRLALFYDLLCVKAYGDDGLALFIGDEETFTAVGAHSWKALCKDCGFGLPETLKGFRKMAQDFLPAWRKEPDRTVLDTQPTAAEAAVEARMTQVIQAHTANALVMSEGVA